MYQGHISAVSISIDKRGSIVYLAWVYLLFFDQPPHVELVFIMRKLLFGLMMGAAMVLGCVMLCQDTPKTPATIPASEAPVTSQAPAAPPGVAAPEIPRPLANRVANPIPASSPAGAVTTATATPSQPQAETTTEQVVRTDLRFEPWLRRAVAHSGWEGELKANPGRTRIYGIFCTKRVLVVALPLRSATVEGEPVIDGVLLQFAKRPMRRWSLPLAYDGLNLEGIGLWLWEGERIPRRFTFSFAFKSADPDPAKPQPPSEGWG